MQVDEKLAEELRGGVAEKKVETSRIQPENIQSLAKKVKDLTESNKVLTAKIEAIEKQIQA